MAFEEAINFVVTINQNHGAGNYELKYLWKEIVRQPNRDEKKIKSQRITLRY